MSTVLKIISGLGISLGSLVSYLPQFYNIVKYGNVDGISEPSLILMNLGMMCLCMNSLIFSWSYFFCMEDISHDIYSNFSSSSLYYRNLQEESVRNLDAGECLGNLLPFISIALAWSMVLVYYILFIIYKFKKREKRILSGLHYMFTYVIFLILVIGLALGEKLYHNEQFFITYANVLGIASAVLNGLVYLPQIYLLFRLKNSGNVSLLMYIIQTPGNIVIILLHAFLYHSSISTWITYLVVFIEQFIILLLMLYYKYRSRLFREVEYV